MGPEVSEHRVIDWNTGNEMLFAHWHFNLKLLWPSGMRRDKENHLPERKRATSSLPGHVTSSLHRSEGRMWASPWWAANRLFLLKSAEADMGLFFTSLDRCILSGGHHWGDKARIQGSSSQPQLSSLPPHRSTSSASFSRLSHCLLFFWFSLVSSWTFHSMHPASVFLW